MENFKFYEEREALPSCAASLQLWIPSRSPSWLWGKVTLCLEPRFFIYHGFVFFFTQKIIPPEDGQINTSNLMPLDSPIIEVFLLSLMMKQNNKRKTIVKHTMTFSKKYNNDEKTSVTTSLATSSSPPAPHHQRLINKASRTVLTYPWHPHQPFQLNGRAVVPALPVQLYESSLRSGFSVTSRRCAPVWA